MVDFFSEDGGIKSGIVNAESEYIHKTDEQIDDLALAISRGEVFGSWMVRDLSVERVFIFLMVLGENEIRCKRLVRDNIVHFYEYMSEAAKLSINGYPIFYSGYAIDQHDFDRLNARLNTIEKAIQEL